LGSSLFHILSLRRLKPYPKFKSFSDEELLFSFQMELKVVSERIKAENIPCSVGTGC
jgi:hypothetical protein